CDRRRWTISVLGNDQIRLSGSRRLALVGILAVQKNYYVTILFYTIVDIDSICYKVVGAEHCGIIDRLFTYRFNGLDGVPVDIIGREHLKLGITEHLSDSA